MRRRLNVFLLLIFTFCFVFSLPGDLLAISAYLDSWTTGSRMLERSFQYTIVYQRAAKGSGISPRCSSDRNVNLEAPSVSDGSFIVFFLCFLFLCFSFWLPYFLHIVIFISIVPSFALILRIIRIPLEDESRKHL